MTEKKNIPIAAIDIGSNSIHMLIATLGKKASFITLDSFKVNFRLGEELDSMQYISTKGINKVVETLSHMKELATSYEASIRAVATHTVRVARNKKQLIDTVKKKTGISIDIIDGVEEARLGALGMQCGLPVGGSTFLGIDIGGGSTELIVCNLARIDYATSVKVGSAFLSQTYQLYSTLSKEKTAALRQDIGFRIGPICKELRDFDFEKVILGFGAAKELAVMLASKKESGSDVNGFQFHPQRLKGLIKTMEKLKTPTEIKRKWGIEQHRAQTIFAVVLILDILAEGLGIENYTVSSYGLRHGTVLDTLQRLDVKVAKLPYIRDVRRKNILRLGEHFSIDKQQAKRVTRSAIILFKQLVDLELAPKLNTPKEDINDEDLLRIAGYLHECGKFLSFSRFHHHNYYLITNSQFMGFSQKERILIGLIARFYRKGEASKKILECEDLSSNEIHRVNYLASILRLAASANRSRSGIVKDLILERVDHRLLQIKVIYGREKNTALVDTLKLEEDKHFLEEQLKQIIVFS